jgi:hypothetical protein
MGLCSEVRGNQQFCLYYVRLSEADRGSQIVYSFMDNLLCHATKWGVAPNWVGLPYLRVSRDSCNILGLSFYTELPNYFSRIFSFHDVSSWGVGIFTLSINFDTSHIGSIASGMSYAKFWLLLVSCFTLCCTESLLRNWILVTNPRIPFKAGNSLISWVVCKDLWWGHGNLPHAWFELWRSRLATLATFWCFIPLQPSLYKITFVASEDRHVETTANISMNILARRGEYRIVRPWWRVGGGSVTARGRWRGFRSVPSV